MSTGQTVSGRNLPTHGIERPSRLIGGIAEFTGFSRRSVYKWIAAGEVEYFWAANGSLRIYLDSLQPKHMAKIAELVQAAADQVQ